MEGEYFWLEISASSFSSVGIVCIMDRYGSRTEEIRIGMRIDNLCWDHSGEVLAIVCKQMSTVTVFELPTKQIISLDLAMGTKSVCLTQYYN